MRNTAEQGLNMLHLVGTAMYARPDQDQQEARRYFQRLLRLICASGSDEYDPSVYSTTDEGKQLYEAGILYLRLMKLKPDPDALDKMSCMSEFKAWYGTVLLTAAGIQQEYELNQK